MKCKILSKIKVEDFILNNNKYHFKKPLYLELTYLGKHNKLDRYYCWEPIFKIYAVGKTQESMLTEFKEYWDELYRGYALIYDSKLHNTAKALKRKLLEYCEVNKI